jgi:hypothetical protein
MVARAASLAALLLCPLCNAASSSVAYHSVSIGGGGYVAAIVPTVPSAIGPAGVYFRTDVGASYRMSNASGVLTWEPLLDALTFENRNWYGGDSIAPSFQNASRLWISAGAYLEAGERPVGIFESADAGTTWCLLTPSDRAWCLERFAVSWRR